MNWLYVGGVIATTVVILMIVVITGAFPISAEQCYEKYMSQMQDKEGLIIPSSPYYSDSACNAVKVTDYYETNYFRYHDLNWHPKDGVHNAPQPDKSRMEQIQQVGIQKGMQGIKELLKLCAQIGGCF